MLDNAITTWNSHLEMRFIMMSYCHYYTCILFFDRQLSVSTAYPVPGLIELRSVWRICLKHEKQSKVKKSKLFFMELWGIFTGLQDCGNLFSNLSYSNKPFKECRASINLALPLNAVKEDFSGWRPTVVMHGNLQYILKRVIKTEFILWNQNIIKWMALWLGPKEEPTATIEIYIQAENIE